MLVEAKNENINSGLGQCVAGMLAAQFEIDLKEYYLSEIDQIFGILKAKIQNGAQQRCHIANLP